ncbi:hexitol phosphatase HxpB [bacterium]|nr:hexitol phosphatase HxpB [bacterium]
MIRAAIFDMDGVLIDSEPLWQEAEKKVFAGIGIQLTTAMCLETMGLRTDEVVIYWYDRQPWSGPSCQKVVNDILDELEDLISARGEAMEGVCYILNFFRKRKIRLALATSSAFRVINVVLEKLKLTNSFEVIHSAEREKLGKPDPAIYTSTLGKLQLSAHETIAFEDSYNGLLAAKGAKIKTVAIPEASAWNDVRFDTADLKLKSLFDFKPLHLSLLNSQTPDTIG